MRFSGAIEGLIGGRLFKRASREGHYEYISGVIYIVTTRPHEGGDKGDTVKCWVPWKPSQEDLLAQDWEHFVPPLPK